MLKKLIQEIFPKVCGICGKISKSWICPKCYYKIKNELKFFAVKQKSFKIYFLGFYEKNIRKLLLRYKFGDSAYLSNLFIELIIKNSKLIQNIKQYDYIIPVPMFIKNKKVRGYNQTDVLIKIKENKRQSTLNEKERIENVKNVYKIQNTEKIKNRDILLIDDIYTTGNTVKQCVKELKKAKVHRIDVFVIAKTR